LIPPSYRIETPEIMSADTAPIPDLASLLATPIFEPIPEAEVSVVLNSAPFIPIPQALNLRTISTATLPPNVLFRSGTLSNLPAPVLASLKEKYNITTIFDLRGGKELEKSPSVQIDGIETIWIPSGADFGSQIEGENETAPAGDKYGKPSHRDSVKPAEFATNDGVDGYIKLYSNFLETHKDAYKAVFERLRDGDGGVLFHCTAGKDRTGILSALIMALMGASKDQIAEDYALTRIGIEPFREYLLAALTQQMGKTFAPGKFEEPGMEQLCGVRGPTIVSVLEWMDEKWGKSGKGNYPGVEGYLIEELGFDGKGLEDIKRKLAAGGQ
ncbi:Tyrosine-protein phosphatase, partial [Lachnellula suecica]